MNSVLIKGALLTEMSMRSIPTQPPYPKLEYALRLTHGHEPRNGTFSEVAHPENCWSSYFEVGLQDWERLKDAHLSRKVVGIDLDAVPGGLSVIESASADGEEFYRLAVAQ